MAERPEDGAPGGRDGCDSVGRVTEPTPDVPRPAPPPPTGALDEPSSVGDGHDLDLDDVERTLDGVGAALERLDDGSYWTDEVTGEPLPDELLEADPVARRTP